MSAPQRRCHCSHRQFRTNRRPQRTQRSGLPCSTNAATLAKAPSKSKSDLKVHDFAFEQRSDRRPNEAGLRNQRSPGYVPGLRHASHIWAHNKQNPSLTKTPLSSIAIARAYFPRPEPEEGAPRQLPIPYYDAPAVILPDGVRCSNFTGACAIPAQDRRRMLAEAVAKKRNRGEPITTVSALDLDFSLCL